MKTFKIFVLLVIVLCVSMYILVDFSYKFLFPIMWLFWLWDYIWVEALVGWESFWRFPTLFGFSIMVLWAIISLVILYYIAKYVSKNMRKK